MVPKIGGETIAQFRNDKKSLYIMTLSGGAEGNRTPDLCSAIAALSHLSYSPETGSDAGGVDVSQVDGEQAFTIREVGPFMGSGGFVSSISRGPNAH